MNVMQFTEKMDKCRTGKAPESCDIPEKVSDRTDIIRRYKQKKGRDDWLRMQPVVL